MVLLKKNSNTKISEIEGKIPSISGLATNTTLTAVENKISNISGLVKKTKQNKNRLWYKTYWNWKETYW